MNNEKIKEIEDFSKGMWLNYGCKVAKEILNKAKTDTANFIEQLLSDYDWGSKESYASLLPEIADIMSISTSTLENHPPLVQLRLEMAYAHFWFSDKRTIYDVLSSILKNYL